MIIMKRIGLFNYWKIFAEYESDSLDNTRKKKNNSIVLFLNEK